MGKFSWSRPGVQALALLVLVTMLLPGQIVARELKKVTLSHSAPDALAPLVFFYAKERGYFSAEGIDPIFKAAKTTLAIAALLAGDLDFTMSSSDATKAVTKGAKLKTVFSLANRVLFWFHARPEIKTIQELKGKKVGVDVIGGPPHLAISAMLREAGLDPSRDVLVVNAGLGMARFAALKAGSIDAMASTTSTFAPSQRAGFTNLGYAGRMSKDVSAGLVTTDRLIQQQPDLIKGMIRGMVKGIQSFRRDRPGAVAIMVKQGQKAEDAGILYDEVINIVDETGIPDAEAMRQTIERMKEATQTTQPISLEEAFALRLVQEVNRELKAAGWRP